MNRIFNLVAQLPPHRSLDIGMGSVATAALVVDPNIMTVLASGASFVYFIIMIGEKVVKWWKTQKDKRNEPR